MKSLRFLPVALSALILLSCSSFPGTLYVPTVFYKISGSVSGLVGSGLILLDNGASDLSLAAGATSFTFSATVGGGGQYDVTVASQPSGPLQTCVVTNGSGSVRAANVTNVQVACTTNAYTIGGTVSGLTGTGLVLQDNAGDNLSISPGSTSFTFTTPIASGGGYNVTIFSHPFSQTCTVADGSGPITNTNITSVQVICTTARVSTFAYVSNQRDNTISAYLVSADGTLTALPSSPSPGGSNPAGLAVDPSGKFLYVANVLADNVSGYAIAPDGALSPIPGSPFTAGTFPYEVAFVTPGATGTFAYAANRNSDNISGFSIQPNGALSAVSGSPFAAGTFPLALAVDLAFNRLYAVNTGSSTVSAYSVQVDGSLVQFSTIGTGAFAASAVVDTNEHLYVAAAGSGVFGYMTNAFPATPIPGSPFAAGQGPNAVRIDPSGQFLYVVNEDGGSVSGYSINAATGPLTQIPGSPFTTGESPYSIAFSAPPSTPVAWYLNNVQFTNGDTESGSFTYDASTNTVSKINIVSGSTAYTQLASTLPVHPFEFVFVPSGMLITGVPEPALVLFPTPGLKNAGGSVSLTGVGGNSLEGLICKDDCGVVILSSQAQSGSSLSSTPPTQ